MFDLGRATGYIRINASDALAAYGKTRAAHAATMSALERSAMTTKRIGLAFGTVGAAAVGGFLLATKASADFEKRLSFLQAVTRATPKQMDAVEKSAFKLGQRFGITANDVADAYTELGKAGVTIQQLVGGVGKATIELARAGDTSAAEAATTLVNITSSFHIAASQSTKVADILAGAANASTVDITDLAFSMKYAGATAHAMGVPLRSVADAMALLGNNGIRGSTAGTSLRRMMIQLTGPTSTSYAALQKLGIITKEGANQFFNAQGKLRGLAQVSQILRQATSKLSREQRTQAFNTIFGSRALAAANILTKAGAKGFAEMHKQVGRTTAEEVATKRLNNLAGALDKLKAAFTVALIKSGAPAQKPLMQLVGWLTRLLKAFGNLNPATQQNIVRFVLLTGVLFTLAGAFMLTVSFAFRLFQTFKMIKEMKAAFMGMRVVITILTNLRVAFFLLRTAMMAVFTNPVGIAIAAIVALGIASYELYKHWAPFRKMINSIGKAFVWLGKTIVAGVKTAFGWVRSHMATIAATIMVLFPGFALLTAAIYELGAHWRGVWTGIQNVARGAVVVIVATFKYFVNWWRVHWHAAEEIVRAVWAVIGPLVRVQLSILTAQVRFAMKMVTTAFRVAWIVASGSVRLAWHLIRNYVTYVWHLITNMVKVVADILQGHWGRAWNDAQHLVGQAFKDIGHTITQFFHDAGHLLYDAGRALVTGFIHGIVSLGSSLYHTVRHALVDNPVHWVTSGFGIASPSKVTTNLGKAIGVGLAVGISSTVPTIKAAVTEIVTVVGLALQDVVTGVNAMISAAKAASHGNKIQAAMGTKLARLTGEADARGITKNVGMLPQKNFSYHMPNLDLSGGDLSGGFGGGGSGSGSSGGGSKKSRKAAAKAAHKHVDLRALFQSGQWLMEGFRKGMEQGSKGIRSYMVRLQERIHSYFNKAKSYGDVSGMKALKRLDKQVTSYGNHMLRLAKRRDDVIRRIDKQKKHLDSLMTLKANYAKDVQNSIDSLGELTQVITKTDASGNVDVSAENIVGGLKNTVASVKEYGGELAKLRKMGLNKRTYNQLVKEGPEAGGAYARALLDGGQGTIDQVNSLSETLHKAAVKMGKKTSNEMYNNGIQASKGIIQGLKDKEGGITKIMRRVAHNMVTALKKELKIKSPSMVMHGLGRNTTKGYALGILAEAHRVRKAASVLGNAALPQSSMHSMRGAGVSAPSLRVVAELPDDFSRGPVEVKQYIKSTEPKLAADESARKMRTAAAMGVFS